MVEAGQEVVSGIRLGVVIARVHFLRFDQLQDAADGRWQEGGDHPGAVGDQGAGHHGVQLVVGGQKAPAAAWGLAVLGPLVGGVVAHALQFSQLLGLARCEGGSVCCMYVAISGCS